MRIDVEVRGDRAAAQLLDRLGRRLEDGRPQLLGLLDEIRGAQRERFQGRGARWRRLAASTVRKDREQGRDPRTLVLTGRLMDSLTVPGHPAQRVTVRPGELRFGTRVFYATYHHRGKGVPRRTVAGLTRAQRVSVTAELKRLLLEDT